MIRKASRMAWETNSAHYNLKRQATLSKFQRIGGLGYKTNLTQNAKNEQR